MTDWCFRTPIMSTTALSVFLLFAKCDIAFCEGSDANHVGGDPIVGRPANEVPLVDIDCVTLREVASMSARVMNVTIHAQQDHLVSMGFNESCIPEFMESMVNPHMHITTSGTLKVAVTIAKGLTMTLVEEGVHVNLKLPFDPKGQDSNAAIGSFSSFKNLLTALNSTGVVRTGPLVVSKGGTVDMVDWLCDARFISGTSELSLRPLCGEVGAAEAMRIGAALGTDHFGRRTAVSGLSGEDIHAVLSYQGPRCLKTCARLEALRELRQESFLTASMYSVGCYCDNMAAGSFGSRTPVDAYTYVGYDITLTTPIASSAADVTGAVPLQDDHVGRRRRPSLFFKGMERVVGARIKESSRLRDSDPNEPSVSDSVAYTAGHIFSGTALLWLPQGFLVATGVVVSISRGQAVVADRDAYTYNGKIIMVLVSVIVFLVRIIDGSGSDIGLGFMFSTDRTMVVLEYISVTLSLFMTVAGLFSPDRVPFGQSSAIQYVCACFAIYMVAVASSEMNPDALLLVFTVLTVVSSYGFYMVARNATATSDAYPMLIIWWNFVTCVATELWALSSTLSAAYSPQIGALVYIVSDYLPHSLPCDSPFFLVRSALHLDDATIWADELTDRVWIHMVGAPALIFLLRVAATIVPRCAVAFRAVRAPTFDSTFMLFCYSFWAYLVDMSCVWRHFTNLAFGLHVRPSSSMLFVHVLLIYIDYTCIRELFYVRALLSTLWWLSGASLIRLSSASIFSASVRLSSKEFKVAGALPSVQAEHLHRMCQSNYRVEVVDSTGATLAGGTCVIAMINSEPTVTTISHFSDCVGVPHSIKIVGTPEGQDRFVGLVLALCRPSLLPEYPQADPVTRYRLLPNENSNMEMGFTAGLKQGFPDATQDDIASAKMIFVHTYECENMTALQDLSMSFKTQGRHATIEEVAVDVCFARGDSGGGAFLVLPSGAIRYLGAVSRAIIPARGCTNGPSNLVSVVGAAVIQAMELRRLIPVAMVKALRKLPIDELRAKRLKAHSEALDAENAHAIINEEYYAMQLAADDLPEGDKPKHKQRVREKERAKGKAQSRAKLMRSQAHDVRADVIRIVDEFLADFKTSFTSEAYNLPGDWRVRAVTQFRPFDAVMHHIADQAAGSATVSPRFLELMKYVDTVLPRDSPDVVVWEDCGAEGH